MIDVLEAQYNGSYFPVIDLGWDKWPENYTVNAHQELIRRMALPLTRFVQSVNWEELSRIRTEGQNATDMNDLQKILAQEPHPLARRCQEAIADPGTMVQLAPEPLDAAKFYAIHSKPARIKERQRRQSNKPFLPALKPLAEAGEQICLHHVTTETEAFSIITDVALQCLIVNESLLHSIHSNRWPTIWYVRGM